MKIIEDVENVNEESVGTIGCGELFRYENHIYMKTDLAAAYAGELGDKNQRRCINMETGRVEPIAIATLVEPLRGQLTILGSGSDGGGPPDRPVTAGYL